MMVTTLTNFIDTSKPSGLDYRTDENRLEGFLKYANAGISIWEVDPSTKIIPALFKLYDMDVEEQYWFTFLYRVTYSTPGALYLWKNFPWKSFDRDKFVEWFYPNSDGGFVGQGQVNKITFSHDRWRQKYDSPDAIDGYIALVEKYGSQENMFKSLTPYENPQKNFDRFWGSVRRIHTFGTVTTFNYLETLHRVMGVNIDAPSLMIQETWKPRKGITYLMTGQADLDVPVSKLEAYAKYVRDIAKQRFPNLGVNMLIMHRLCCLYGGLAIGNRYFGYYLDRNQSETLKLEKSDPELAKVLWKIREEMAPHHLLGEFGGWVGKREYLLNEFKRYGRLVNIE